MARSSAFSSARPGSAGPGAVVPRVYLDYGGFSPVDPRVVAVMRPFLEGGVGNPGAPHSLGLEARASLDGARAKVARLIGGTPSGVIFTASATEANNLAIRGIALRATGRHIVTSAIEHVSVINACRDLEKQGFAVTYVPVDSEGRVDPEAVARAARGETALVSFIAANGEIGTLQPIEALGRVARARGVPFHVDAVGAAGRVPLDVDEAHIDLLALSSNDLYGPPGAGALWVRPETKLAPMILGGGQEGGYRAGTENLPAIVGMGVAADLARLEGPAEVARLRELRDRLLAGLLERLPEARLTGARGEGRLPHHVSFVVPGVKADGVLLELDLRGVAASSGSACNALTGEPSHVLRAIGYDRDALEGSLCFTLGRWTTASEIDVVVETLPAVVARLRRLAPR
jgi:cysteine desulfurase